MTTIIHLVRHGEVFNPKKILYGRIPGYRLSTRGQQMAEATAASFQDHTVSALYASPLQRAQETALPFARRLSLDIRTSDSLLEAGNDLEGLHIKGVRSALWNPRYWYLLRNPLQPSWGEPYEDIARRMWSFIQEVRQEVEGGEAICVSHQLPIVCIQRFVQGKRLAHNPSLRQCNLASVSSIIFEGDQCQGMVYSEPAAAI